MVPLLFVLACALLVPGCNRPSSSPGQPAQSGAPAQPNSAAVLPKLAAGECGAPDGARGFIRISSSDLSGAYERCSFDLSGAVGAVEGKQIGGKDSSLIVLSFTRTGTVRCEKGSPIAVNYRAQNPADALFVASSDKFGKCEISNTIVDPKRWTGKLTATLVPGGKDQGKNYKPIQMQAEWDIRKP